MDRIKKSLKSITAKNGSYSVGLIVLVICIVVVINMIAAKLPENIKNIDVSDTKIYEISDTSRDILKKLDHNVTFTVYAEKSSADERIKTFIKKYTALTDKVKVKWVDPVQHPSELSKNNIEANNILVSCADTKKTTAISFDDIIVSDTSSYYTTGSATESEFDGEGQFTSAINYVTSDSAKKLYYTSGHGETTFSTAVSDLFEKNNMSETELNLVMDNKIPDDCDLLFMDGPTKDISKDEKDTILAYMQNGGKVFLMLGDMDGASPNLDALMKEYGMTRADGYIADTQRCYQNNYYYIFPQITASGDLADGLSTNMVLLTNAHGMTLTDPARDTITTTDFMTTSEGAYAVTDSDQTQGTYVLGATATETLAADDAKAADDSSSDGESKSDSDSNSDSKSDSDTAEKTSTFTVVTSASMIDSQITDNFTTLENLDLFMNAVTANFDDVKNVAIESKSLAITYNTPQHVGVISILIIFGIPAVILIYGFSRWWKRRKA